MEGHEFVAEEGENKGTGRLHSHDPTFPRHRT